MTSQRYRTKANDTAERARVERWNAVACSRVTHPDHGSVVVPHGSNYAAIVNAAEYWGCNWLEILGATVMAALPNERPVPMPPYRKEKNHVR